MLLIPVALLVGQNLSIFILKEKDFNYKDPHITRIGFISELKFEKRSRQNKNPLIFNIVGVGMIFM